MAFENRDEYPSQRAAIAEKFGMTKVRIDDRVLRVLTAINSAGDLGKLALRGARYGLPGWVTEQEARAGKTSTSTSRALRPTARHPTTSPAPIVMAMFGDQHAVAQSRRSYYAPTEGMPWAGDVEELVDAVVVDNLGDTWRRRRVLHHGAGRRPRRGEIRLDRVLARDRKRSSVETSQGSIRGDPNAAPGQAPRCVGCHPERFDAPAAQPIAGSATARGVAPRIALARSPEAQAVRRRLACGGRSARPGCLLSSTTIR
jgi:hypothetical protein